MLHICSVNEQKGHLGGSKGLSFVLEAKVIRTRKDLMTIRSSHTHLYFFFFKMEEQGSKSHRHCPAPSLPLHFASSGPSTSSLTTQCGLVKAAVQEVEGGLKDIRVSGAACPTQLAHCKRSESSGAPVLSTHTSYS